MLARLIAPWCQPKMSGNRARPFEARRIVNGSLEGQRGNRPNTRNGHYPEADLIPGGGTFDTAVQFKKVLIQDQSRIEQRDNRMRQDFIHFNHRTDEAVKAAMLHCLGKTEAEDLQQPAHFIGEINCLVSNALRVLSKARTPCASRLFM